MKDEATPEQLAMARRICAGQCDVPTLARNYMSGMRDGTKEMDCALAAIIETQRRDAAALETERVEFDRIVHGLRSQGWSKSDAESEALDRLYLDRDTRATEGGA